MSKQNSAECQFAINMFKATEMSMKKLLDLLEKTVEQKKSFRSLSLMINKIKGQETELKKLSEEVMRQQPHQSTASSILNRQTTLITRLNELELQVDLLDDDGQLSQSSSRIRDDVSMISSRRNLSRQSTPAPSDDKERIQHQRDIEGKQTSSNIFNQPPPLPPRPRQPSLFLQTSNEPGLQIQHVLEAHQRNPKKEVHESLLKSKTKLGNELNVPNPFPCFDKDISQKFTSPTRSGKLEIASNLVNRDVCDIETAQINLSDNFDTSQNLLPPIQNLNLSGNHSLSNPFILADPTIQLQADGPFAQNSALEKTLNLKLPKRRNNQDSYANRNPQYHNFPNLQQNVGPSEVQIGTNGYLDSQVLNCDLQKLPCLPTVANRTSHLPSTTDKIVAENNCLQSNQYINPITGVHSASVPPITVQLMEQQHQNTVLNPAAPNFLPNQVAPQSNGIAAPLQFPQPVNSQHGFTSTFPVNQNVTQPSQLCNNQFVPDSQVPSNCQAPLTSTIHAPMCINQHSNPTGQNQLSQPLINQSLLPTVNQHISSAYSNPNVTQEKGNVDFKHSIKLPPLKLQNFNGDPIHFHEWINNFNTMIHNNPSITDTHRITYLQNSVSGKAKDLIHAYSCDPSYYQTALNELIRHFGDRRGDISVIGEAKRTLLIILGSRRLSLDVFRTILVETEAILNSRPLTIVADLPENEMPLTPNHFLINRPFNSLPPGKFDSQEPASFKSWKNVQQMVNHFWKRLVKEYLPTLLKRSKWSDSDQTPLRVNDIVWILKDMTPRGIWPLGRVLEVYPGRDGQHRVVKVKTAYGTYVRPVSALARVLAD